MVDLLKGMPGWGVGIAVYEEAYILLFATKMMVKGKMFQGCATVSEIVRVCQEDIPRRIRQREEFRQRRLAFVRSLLKQAYDDARAEGETFHLVTSFDTWSDGTPGLSVWLIHLAETSVFDLDGAYRFTPELVRPSLYWLLPDGSMHEYSQHNFRTPDMHP